MTLPRLAAGLLVGLPEGIARPAFAREQAGIGIVHLGLGAFHRAHQAVYFDDLLAAGGGNWAISGVSLRSPDVSAQLAPQDGLYTLSVLDGAEQKDRIIGAVREALFLGTERTQVAARLAAASTKLVTLTVTEKAYCLKSLQGGLDFEQADIRHDLAHPDEPQTVIGLLAEALAARRAAGVAPPTLMSCDNLPENGLRLRRALLDFCKVLDPGLADWTAAEVAFPCTMVDRIVPRTVDTDRADLVARLGCEDHGMVKAEPFSQWVIEDRFCNTRPPLEQVGATLVGDVAPYERIKLRMLLGSHSTIAYLGCLAGFRYVHEAMASPIGALVAQQMEQEIMPVAGAPAGFDLRAYQGQLLARFANSGLRHEARQIAMDGSQKVPIRLLGTLTERLSRGLPSPRLTLAVAAWIRYASGLPDGPRSWVVDDPRSTELGGIGAAAGSDARRLAQGFLELAGVFPAELSGSPTFRAQLEYWIGQLLKNGALATVKEALA